MGRALLKISGFIAKRWWWFFTAVLLWTVVSGVFFYISLIAFKPDDVLRRLRWARPPEVVELWEPYIYALSTGLIIFLLFATILPISYLLFVRFFGFKRNGRV